MSRSRGGGEGRGGGQQGPNKVDGGWGQEGVQAGGVLTSVGLVGARQFHLFASLLKHISSTHRCLMYSWCIQLMPTADVYMTKHNAYHHCKIACSNLCAQHPHLYTSSLLKCSRMDPAVGMSLAFRAVTI